MSKDRERLRGPTAFEATRCAGLGPPGKPGTSDPLQETDPGKRKEGCAVRSREGTLMQREPRGSFRAFPHKHCQRFPARRRVKSVKTLQIKPKG